MSDNSDSDQPQQTLVRTFLIADIRGYSTFTQERGDEAAARLASAFAVIARQAVDEGKGRMIELRGDEALSVFDSTRQALRTAVNLQTRFALHSEEHPDLPLPVGIGIDAGEAVPVEGGFRGGALNVAARLCSLAGSGEILASEAVTHLARKVEGLAYIERGPMRLKGFSESIRAVEVVTEQELSKRDPASGGQVVQRDHAARPSFRDSPGPAGGWTPTTPQPPGAPGGSGLDLGLASLGEQLSSLIQERVASSLSDSHTSHLEAMRRQGTDRRRVTASPPAGLRGWPWPTIVSVLTLIVIVVIVLVVVFR